MNWKRVPESQGWIQRLGEWAIRKHTFMPRMLDLEVSRVCNLGCPSCMRHASSSLSHLDNKYCTLDTFKKIHEEIPTIGTLNFMGDGEPLMNPELDDIIHYSSLNNIHTVVTTNATLITQEIIAQWKRNKVYRIHASIDAAKKDVYEKLRVGAEWGKTYENLKILGKSGIALCLNCILYEDTMPYMPDMVRLCVEVGSKEVSYLMPLVTWGTDVGVRPKDNPENRYLFEVTRRKCKELGVRWTFPLTLNPTFRRFNFPFIRPEVSADGDVYACCYSLGRGKVWFEGYGYELGPNDYRMGNIFKEGFRKVWYGEDYKRVRDIYIKSEVKKGTIISRQELLNKTRIIFENPKRDRFDHCLVCLARWGAACS